MRTFLTKLVCITTFPTLCFAGSVEELLQAFTSPSPAVRLKALEDANELAVTAVTDMTHSPKVRRLAEGVVDLLKNETDPSARKLSFSLIEKFLIRQGYAKKSPALAFFESQVETSNVPLEERLVALRAITEHRGRLGVAEQRRLFGKLVGLLGDPQIGEKTASGMRNLTKSVNYISGDVTQRLAQSLEETVGKPESKNILKVLARGGPVEPDSLKHFVPSLARIFLSEDAERSLFAGHILLHAPDDILIPPEYEAQISRLSTEPSAPRAALARDLATHFSIPCDFRKLIRNE